MIEFGREQVLRFMQRLRRALFLAVQINQVGPSFEWKLLDSMATARHLHKEFECKSVKSGTVGILLHYWRKRQL